MAFNDSIEIGKIAEEMYKQFLIASGKIEGKDFIDVRNNDDLCQWLDIDFIILKNNHNKQDVLNDIRSGNPKKRKERINNIGYAVEVKLDTVTHNRYKNKDNIITEGTGNLVYELISHNMPGCLARSYADFILYVCVDNFEYITQLKKVYMINLFNWRKSMTQIDAIKKQNIKLKPIETLKEFNANTNTFEFVNENILNILCPVKNLIDNTDNTIMDWTNKFSNFFPNNLHVSA